MFYGAVQNLKKKFEKFLHDPLLYSFLPDPFIILVSSLYKLKTGYQYNRKIVNYQWSYPPCLNTFCPRYFKLFDVRHFKNLPDV